MLYLIGLGNPGEKYHFTRHNIGWIVLDEILSCDWSANKYMNALTYAGAFGLYIKPQTLMNRSGEVISFLQKEYHLEDKQLIVIYDDIDLPLGVIRISFDRGDGGHNGIKSIVNHLHSKKFIRIRIGISRLINDNRLAKPNVLGIFSDEDMLIIKNELSPRVDSIIKSIASEGLEKTMNIFNTR